MGGNLDTANELFYKWLFARDAGVEEKQIQALLSSQMDLGPQGATKFRKDMMVEHINNPHIPLHETISNKYYTSFQEMIRSPEGQRHIAVSRIKLLGVFLNMWEFSNQSEEALKSEGSASGFISAALFTASAGIQVALPAWEIMAKVSQSGAASLIGNMPPQGAKLSTWKLRANCCGSFAAALAVVSDLGDLQESFDKEGSKRWQAVSLVGMKVLSDGAFAIQSSEELLKLLGRKTLQAMITDIAEESTNIVLKTIAGRLLGVISFLASWEVMVLVSIAPAIVAVFTDNDLQDWCEKCVFGSSSEIENPRDMTAEVREQVSQEQEDKLVKALHETFGLPLTEKLQREEDEEKLKQLKAEVQAWQHIHN